MKRFIKAQDNLTTSGKTVYEKAVEEISNGDLKIHCWIRYLYPQLTGLGKSEVTKFFEIKGREEAKEYMNHPLLRERYLRCCQAIIDSGKTVYEIFRHDAMRIRASLLLMNSVYEHKLIKRIIREHRWL